MKGDILIIEEKHKRAAEKIVEGIIDEIKISPVRYTISIAGESGSGKSEMAKAISDCLKAQQIHAVILGQDDYFNLPPKSNDAKRRKDPGWLGPHVEIAFDVFQSNISDAKAEKEKIIKPTIDYNQNTVSEETVKLEGVKIILAEGTYTSLLRHIDKKIFITASRLETLQHRKKRNRGNEVGDPFIENILEIEHKIIAGHQYLADIVLTKNFDVKVKD